MADIYSLSGESGYGCRGWRVGEVIPAPKEVRELSPAIHYLVVLTANARYYCEDGLSSGDDSGYLYRATARAATESESADLRAAEAAAGAKLVAWQHLRAIMREIEMAGERPSGQHYPSGTRVMVDGKGLLYGGGQWLVLADDAVWYVRNNGSDGGDWSANNIRTGGAGAIGSRLDSTRYHDEIVGLARQLGMAITTVGQPQPTKPK